MYFGGGHKAMFCGILRDRWKNLRHRFGLSNHLEKHWTRISLHDANHTKRVPTFAHRKRMSCCGSHTPFTGNVNRAC